jgi:hypothetical protein
MKSLPANITPARAAEIIPAAQSAFRDARSARELLWSVHCSMQTTASGNAYEAAQVAETEALAFVKSLTAKADEKAYQNA